MLSLLRPFGKYILGVVAALATALGFWKLAKRSGRQEERREQTDADLARADQIHERADNALENHAADDRTSDDQLREHGRFRD